MSPNNGALCVAMPLFRYQNYKDCGVISDFSIILVVEKPIAYAIDIGDDDIYFFNAEWVEKNLEFLGDL